MAHLYILIDYKGATDEYPRVVSETKDLDQGIANFTTSAERKVRSVVLYDTKQDEVIKIAIDGEPIYLVRAIELARKNLLAGAVVWGEKKAISLAASAGIDALVKAFAGEAIPGVSGAIMGHFTGPYYALKGDAPKAGGAAAGIWGCMSGGIVGEIVGGPPGAVVGAVVGGAGMSLGTEYLIRSLSPPTPKCTRCKGTGLVEDYRTCKNCKGFGYRK